jgi:hypothetical protein
MMLMALNLLISCPCAIVLFIDASARRDAAILAWVPRATNGHPVGLRYSVKPIQISPHTLPLHGMGAIKESREAGETAEPCERAS